MKVKSTSWHYRLNVWAKGSWDTKHKKDLCSYFWFTVGNIAGLSILSIFTVLMAVMGPFAIGMVLMSSMGYAGGWAAIGAWLIGAVVIASLVGITIGCCTMYDKWKYRDRPQKAPGLIKSYYQANVKEKVCPFIEFED